MITLRYTVRKGKCSPIQSQSISIDNSDSLECNVSLIPQYTHAQALCLSLHTHAARAAAC